MTPDELQRLYAISERPDCSIDDVKAWEGAIDEHWPSLYARLKAAEEMRAAVDKMFDLMNVSEEFRERTWHKKYEEVEAALKAWDEAK